MSADIQSQSLDAVPRVIKISVFLQMANLTHGRFEQIVADGWIPEPQNGYVSALGAIGGLCEYYEKSKNIRKHAYNDEKLLKLKADRKIAESEYAQIVGSLLPAATVEKAWAGVIVMIRQRLMGLASKLTPRIVACKSDQNEIRTIIAKEIEDILASLATAPVYRCSDGSTDNAEIVPSMPGKGLVASV